MEDLYKQAILDAKALRASAMANAKAALQEAFEPKIQEMLRQSLSEEEEEEMDEAKEPMAAKKAMAQKMKTKDSIKEEELDEEELDEADELDESEEELDEADELDESDEELEEEELDETSLEEILGELEALANEGTEEGEEELDEESEEEMEEATEEEGEEESEEGMEDHEAGETEGEEDEEKIITITLGQLKDILSPYQADEEGAEGAEGAEVTDDEEANIDLDEIFAELEETKEMGKSKKVAKEMDEQKQLEVPGTEKQLKEANRTISYLQTQLKEVNLLNAKYLFMNKLFKGKSLTESQKVRAINAFDRAASVKEVKNIFATLNESFSTIKKKSINEGFASQAAGVAPKQSTIESDPFIARMQTLAGINKK